MCHNRFSTSMRLATGTPSFNITISEIHGFDADPINLSISTQSFIPHQLEVVDFVFNTDVGVMKLGKKLIFSLLYKILDRELLKILI